VRAAAAVLLVLFALIASCSLFENLPDRSCKVDDDCFKAQGERCDQQSHTCVAGPDAHLASPLESP
jgi:hypothetical protein